MFRYRIERIQYTAVSNLPPEIIFNGLVEESISPEDGESRLEKLGPDETAHCSGWIVGRKDETGVTSQKVKRRY